MQKTPNLGLKKPDLTDFYNIQDFNDNADTLDTAIANIESLVSGSSGIAIVDAVIPVSGWISSGDGFYIDISSDISTEKMIPIAVISPENKEIALNCKFSSPFAGSGFIRFYAKQIPTEAVTVSVTLLSPSKSFSGVTTTDLLPATATRLGGVKIGSGIDVVEDGTISVNGNTLAENLTASDEDVEKAIDEILPGSNS